MEKIRPIVVTAKDLERLRGLIQQCRESDLEEPETLQPLERELDRAEVVESGEVPANVITMNTTVQVRVGRSKSDENWTIVYPADADFDEDRISILAPIGTALLGYREGDTLEWQVPAGQRKYKVVKIVHQPEGAGEFDR